MTNLKIKVGDTEITVELDGCSADFDGKTLKIKADSVVNNVTENHYHHHYVPSQPTLPTLNPWSPNTFTYSGGQSQIGMGAMGWNLS